MNRLTAHIEGIKTHSQLSLIELKINNYKITSIVVETPDKSSYIKLGEKVKVLFKETEVIIATTFTGQISLQNQLPGIVTYLEKGKLLTSVSIDGEWGELVAIITTKAANELKLEKNTPVTAMIKTNEIMLGPC